MSLDATSAPFPPPPSGSSPPYPLDGWATLVSQAYAVIEKDGKAVDQFYHRVLSRYFNTAATAILLYDFCLTFGDETQRIWKDGTWSGAKALWVGVSAITMHHWNFS